MLRHGLTRAGRFVPRSARARSALLSMQRRHASSGGTLVFAAQTSAEGKLDPSFTSCVTAASKLGGPVTALVAGKGCKSVAEEASKVKGVGKVLLSESDAFEHMVAENVAGLLKEVQGSHTFTHIMAPSNTVGKNIMPRFAALLDSAAISDVMGIESEDTFVRPVYAGNVIAKVQSSDSVKIMTIRTTSFDKTSDTQDAAPIEEFKASSPDAGLSKWVKDELSKSDRPSLTSANVVVSGGRGMKSGDNFAMLEELADLMGGAVGASRAAVDAGFVPNDYQVGQTGKVVAPDLYIAVGVSGAIQHLAGMKDSKTIVAVNKDPEAPIFQVADIGIVGDLFKIMPELTEKVKAGK